MSDHIHKWEIVGEDTGGYVEWCIRCGAIKDSGDDIRIPTQQTKQVPNNYIGNPFLFD